MAHSLLSLVEDKKTKRGVDERGRGCGGLKEKREASGSTRARCCSINRSQSTLGRRGNQPIKFKLLYHK